MPTCGCGRELIDGVRCECRPPKPKPHKAPAKSHSVRVGTIFARRVKVYFPKANEGCKCKDLENKMNALGPEGCTEHFEELVSEILESAQQHSLVGRLAASLPLAETKVRQWLQQAIDEARGLSSVEVCVEQQSEG